jgi:anti-sigma-K factor RskA
MTADACREWRGLLAAAALDRSDATDEVALRAHLDGCASCRAELRELTAVAKSLPLADPSRVSAEGVQPPVQLAAQVVDRVADERRRGRRRRRQRTLALAAAAAVVVALGLGGLFALQRDHTSAATTVSFPRGAEATGHAELERHDEGTQVRLVASGLDDGDWYWLWLTGDSGERVSAGTFRGTGAEVDVTLTSALPLDATRRIWVTDDDDKVVLDAHI